MIRLNILIVALLVICSGALYAQEVVIPDFPAGVGADIAPAFFEPYYPQLQTLADTLKKYSSASIIVTGGADGLRYRRYNNLRNPALALGRAHALRNLLVDRFGLDPSRITVQSADTKEQGSGFRQATARIAWGLSELQTQLNKVSARLDTLTQRPTVQPPNTEITHITQEAPEDMGLQLSAGMSSSPFGGVPIVSAAVTWKQKVYIEGIVGHTFWDGEFKFINTILDTRRRLAGGLVAVYPFETAPVGFLAGWIRTEVQSTRYYDYAKMSEGPFFGVRYSPFEYISITGAYNPAKQRIIGEPLIEKRVDELMIMISGFVLFGGDK